MLSFPLFVRAQATSEFILAANVILKCHLRKLPNFLPFDVALLASNHLVRDQAPQVAAFSDEHEPLRIRPSDLEEAKVRIDLRADALERHDRANDVSEARGNPERELVDHVREVEDQLSEIHVAQPQTQITVEQVLDDRLESSLVLGRELDESKPNHVVHQ